MESEFAFHLRHIDKEHLALLVQELVARHPILLTEIVELLESHTQAMAASDPRDGDEVTEDWDFSGQVPAIAQLEQTTFDTSAYQQRLKAYPGDVPESTDALLPDDLHLLLDEAQAHADRHDYQHAIELYSLVLNERLSESDDARAQLFDDALDSHLPELESLLSEASSSIFFNAHASFSPLLTSEMRRDWLKRLFVLWLKRLDAHRQEEHIAEIILNVAWSDDLALLYQLVQDELQLHPTHTHSNIVDFQREYRTRTLEKFLKELPHPSS